MGTYEIKWKVKSVPFTLTVNSDNPEVMRLTRGTGLPQFFTSAEAYILARQIEKNFRHIGMRSIRNQSNGK